MDHKSPESVDVFTDIPPELIQIHASPEEVEKWIEAFIAGKRNLSNTQNIKDFCKPDDVREGCARVDAVFVKRKATRGHIGVEHVSNYWGPQMKSSVMRNVNNPPPKEFYPSYDPEKISQCQQVKKELATDPTENMSDADCSSSKRVFSAAEINDKLEKLRKKVKTNKSDTESS